MGEPSALRRAFGGHASARRREGAVTGAARKIAIRGALLAVAGGA